MKRFVAGVLDTIEVGVLLCIKSIVIIRNLKLRGRVAQGLVCVTLLLLPVYYYYSL